MIFWISLVVAVAGLGFIRLAPSDPAIWHVAPEVRENKDFNGGVKRLVDTGPDGLARFNAIALSDPRTSVLAGSVDQGMVTYVTRSKVFGFPDYTTTQQDGERLKIHARLRFGRSDAGVNRARVRQWIDALEI